MVPLFSVAAWSVQLLITTWTLFTNSRTPSSLVVKNVCVPVTFARTWPVQRTLKVSAAMPAMGAPVPQSKFTVGIERASPPCP